MGCSSSTSTAVTPLRTEEANRGEDDRGSKPDSRGDSAVSKGTADSGVVMEGVQVSSLPGQVPRQLPVIENVVRPKSSEILEELLNQGIIPVGQRSSTAGEAYSIVLDDSSGGSVNRRKPPPRLESLKAARTHRVPSKEEFEEKMRLAERRRKLKEDELVTRLRVRSARVRLPAGSLGSEVDKDTAVAVTPVQLFSQMTREEAEGEEEEEEEVQGAGGGGETLRRDEAGAADGGRGRRSEAGEEEEEEEEEETQVEELENDSSFQRVDDKEEIF